MYKRKRIIVSLCIGFVVITFLYVCVSLHASYQIKKIIEENIGHQHLGYTYCTYDPLINENVSNSADYRKRHLGYYDETAVDHEFQMSFPISVVFGTYGQCFYRYTYMDFADPEKNKGSLLYGSSDANVKLTIHYAGGRWNIIKYYEAP